MSDDIVYVVREDKFKTYTVSKFNFGEDIPVQLYTVTKPNRWRCNCPHHVYRKKQCKHISYVKTYEKTGKQEFEV